MMAHACRCGALVDMRPYYQTWDAEKDDEAWDQSKDEAFQRMVPAIRSNMQMGQFKKDLVAGSAGSSGFCSLPEVQYADLLDRAMPCTLHASGWDGARRCFILPDNHGPCCMCCIRMLPIRLRV